ncbi:MAG: helix-turn-helix domain containing protein [Bacteroidetes bacterium]|nr:helix-turn-helix domain containing protein [Bacteroidota bacterium]MDA0828818.1 helix-turn-helix domain containing protein [Bacteroidota bacterium]MDA1199225.1 helix-turn-helix domain containing protein [Bacteroidota bacterium]
MENDPRHSILTRAMELFQRFGLRAVNMDDVSRELAMSKKTLYTFFSNKSDLVDQAAKYLFMVKSKQFIEQASIFENAIDELFEVQRIQQEVLKNYGTRFIFPLKKYHPETYDWVMHARRTMMIQATTKNLERGIQQKLFREDLQIAHLALIRYNTMVGIMEDPDMGDDPGPRGELLHYSLLMHIRSIATAQGLAYLQELQSPKTK